MKLDLAELGLLLLAVRKSREAMWKWNMSWKESLGADEQKSCEQYFVALLHMEERLKDEMWEMEALEENEDD